MTDSCTETVDHSILKFEDKDPNSKSVFYIDNRKNRRKIERHEVDECLIKGREFKKCDWLVVDVQSQAEIFIELKGEDVKEAIPQLTTTVDKLSKDKIKAKDKLGVVVATEVIPKQRDKLTKQVYKSHKLILLVEKTPYTETIENLLSELGLK